MKTDKLTTKIKVGYSLAGFGDSATYTFVNTFLMFFLTTIAGIDPAIAGTIAAIGALWDSILSPIVGFISDNTMSRYGRRRPFILMAAFPLGIITCLAFTNVGIPPEFKIAYYTLMVIIFWGSFSFFFIPWLAFGAEITDDYDGRTTLRSYTYIMNVAGMTVGMAVPTLVVDGLINRGFTLSTSWSLTGALVGLTAFLSILVTWRTTRGRELIAEKPEAAVVHKDNAVKRMVKGYVEVLKLKPLRFIIATSIFYLVANTLNSSDRMYFFTYNVGLSASQVTIVMFTIIIGGIVFVPGILALAKRYDKRTVLIMGLSLSAIGVGASRFLGVETMVGLIVFAFIFALGNTCYWQLVPAMIYDICELDELLNDKRREGSVVSLQSLSEALSSAISMQMLGLILQFSGFDGDAPAQTESALFWVENAFGIIPSVFMVLAVIMVIKYPITKKSFATIIGLVEKKRGGEEVDLGPINHML